MAASSDVPVNEFSSGSSYSPDFTSADYLNHNKVHVAVKSSPSDSNKSYFCRICHEGDTSEALVAPCKCTGTVALIHTTCLEHWLTTSNSDRCEICKNSYKITREPRSCLEYFHDSGNQWNVRNLIADIICFFLLTPLLIVSTYLCALGANQYFMKERWEAVGLVILSLFLLAVYFTWCHVTTRFHLSTWQAWRRTNQQIRLEPFHETNCPNPNNNRIVNKARCKRQRRLLRDRHLNFNRSMALESVGVPSPSTNISHISGSPAVIVPSTHIQQQQPSTFPSSSSASASALTVRNASSNNNTSNVRTTTIKSTSLTTSAPPPPHVQHSSQIHNQNHSHNYDHHHSSTVTTTVERATTTTTIIQPPNTVTVNLNFNEIPREHRGYLNYSFVDNESSDEVTGLNASRNRNPINRNQLRYFSNPSHNTSQNQNQIQGYVQNLNYSRESNNNDHNNSSNTTTTNNNNPTSNYSIVNPYYRDQEHGSEEEICHTEEQLDESDTSRMISV